MKIGSYSPELGKKGQKKQDVLGAGNGGNKSRDKPSPFCNNTRRRGRVEAAQTLNGGKPQITGAGNAQNAEQERINTDYPGEHQHGQKNQYQ
ncbi:Hypothetical protein ABZS17H1_04551 (plasmid) [Kosakonia cowanii]